MTLNTLVSNNSERCHQCTYRGVGNARLRSAKPRRPKYLFASAIISQVYLLVDSQTSISLYSFKTLNLNLIICFSLGNIGIFS